MYNPFSLVGKTILVTGASSGIGKAVSIQCSKLGAKVVITGRDSTRLNSTFEQLEGEGHISISADLTIYSDIEKLAEACPSLDGFVNNAGITKVILVKNIKRKFIDDIFNINILAPIMLTQLLVKKDVLKDKSSIVFTSSVLGVYCVNYGDSLYAASKGAVSGFVKAAALDLSRKYIRVNSVNPSVIKTDIFNDILTPEELDERSKLFPLKRLGEPNDVAFAIIYFLSDASSWVTGAELKIDGGLTLI